MRTQRNVFLAGLAALALVAGVGLASAQEPSQTNKGAPQAKQPQATHQVNKGPAAGKMGQTAQQTPKGPGAGKMGKTAQQTPNHKAGVQAQKPAEHAARMTKPGTRTAQMQRGKESKKGAMARAEHNKMGQTAQQRGVNRQTTAQGNRPPNMAEQQHKGLEGLQGNASGMNVQLNEEQRGRIRSTVLNAPGAPRVENVTFNVAVGTVIPRGSIRIVPVSPALVQIDPMWRGFLYFVWMDDVVIVNPRTMTIVAVVPV
jgi:hypothetical protein